VHCLGDSLLTIHAGAGPSGLVAAKTLLHNAPRGRSSFRVTIYETRDRIGGLWPTRKGELNLSGVHPLMVANQSKHTVQFSDFAWEPSDPEFPQAWMVGRYLERYAKRYSITDIKFHHRVRRAVLLKDNSWHVTSRSEIDGSEESTEFDYLLVAAGFFGTPVVPVELVQEKLPYCHSSTYRDLGGLFSGKESSGRGGRILVVGGQMSGIEIAATVATHISSLIHSPSPSPVLNAENYKVHHVIQRPIWVFPLFTSPKVLVGNPQFSSPPLTVTQPTSKAAPFVPLDLPSYNLANRQPPLANTQGYISEDAAKFTHSIYQAALQTDQSEFHPLLHVNEDDGKDPPYLAVSDYYMDFVRSGLIEVSSGKLKGLEGRSAVLAPNDQRIDDIAAIVFATGYEASSRLEFLAEDVLKTLNHSSADTDLPLALSFHGTHHPALPTLGFVGYYRSPYWGVMEMQARLIASLWTPEELILPLPTASMTEILKLRQDSRTSQFPMGDYAWLMQEFASALGLAISLPLEPATPQLAHNNKPMDILTPARYISANANDEDMAEVAEALKQTQDAAINSLTTPKFVARGIFRSLLGTWKLERDVTSRSPYQPGGHFSGTARFCLRRATADGLQCVTGQHSLPEHDEISGMEYLYIEEGSFLADNGLQFTATRRYVWRYDEKRDVLSVWFVKPSENKTVDYLFHELEFSAPSAEETAKGWLATAGHLCEEDYYGVQYEFRFRGVNLSDWTIEYSVKGPRKDYTLRGTYKR
jgi:hypothetical protein